MTGPEHYAEAERLLKQANVQYIVTMPDNATMQQVDQVKEAISNHGLDDGLVATKSIEINVTPMLLAAQVHATLAVTAAQALAAIGGGDAEPKQCRAWQAAVS